MGLTSGMNIRLDPPTHARLEKVAASSGLKKADLIRMAVEAYLDEIERTGQLTIKLEQGSKRPKLLGVSADGKPRKAAG